MLNKGHKISDALPIKPIFKYQKFNNALM